MVPAIFFQYINFPEVFEYITLELFVFHCVGDLQRKTHVVNFTGMHNYQL